MSFRITGMDKLTGDKINGYSGSLTVRIPGIGGKKGFTFKHTIDRAPTQDAAKARALKSVVDFAKALHAEASKELGKVAQ